jgi:hypothetical protein
VDELVVGSRILSFSLLPSWLSGGSDFVFDSFGFDRIFSLLGRSSQYSYIDKLEDVTLLLRR